ncbi:MAG: hypothetical protein JNL39_05695 [Opitutaceae bacterium]|nr:hypothetical protein [Opitutaceae bacterium]
MAGAVFGGVFTLGVAARRQAQVARQQPAESRGAVAPAPPIVVAKKNLPGIQFALGAITPQLLQQFTRRLGLTPEQLERVRPVIARAGDDLQRMRQENFADTVRVSERMYEDVAAALTPEQRTELEKMRVQMQERVRKERLKRAAEQAAEGANRPEGEPAPVRPKTKAPKQGAQ